MHPAYRGLANYDALKQQSDGVYDATDADLRSQEGYGGFNNTMNLMHNQVSKQSPWAPYFQALENQGVSKVGMDTGRPHGIADQPGWASQGASSTGAQIPHQPLMDSTNIAGAQPVTPQSLMLNGLQNSLEPLPPQHDAFMAGVAKHLGSRPATPLTYKK